MHHRGEVELHSDGNTKSVATKSLSTQWSSENIFQSMNLSYFHSKVEVGLRQFPPNYKNGNPQILIFCRFH